MTTSSDVYIRVTLEDASVKLIGPMPRYFAELTLHTLARGWKHKDRRVVSARIVPQN